MARCTMNTHELTAVWSQCSDVSLHRTTHCWKYRSAAAGLANRRSAENSSEFHPGKSLCPCKRGSSLHRPQAASYSLDFATTNVGHHTHIHANRLGMLACSNPCVASRPPYLPMPPNALNNAAEPGGSVGSRKTPRPLATTTQLLSVLHEMQATADHHTQSPLLSCERQRTFHQC
jgi:hypothetical protein